MVFDKEKENDKKKRYSRRSFLADFSLGIGAFAVSPVLPGIWENPEAYKSIPDEKKLGVALVGLGNYSTNQLAPALQETRLCKLTGIVTGTPEKEDRWARKYDIPEKNIYNYDTYDRIADNPDIDIIYVVLPNGLHAEYTIRAAEAGKHVISEKPMATSVEDAEAMVRACKGAGRKLSIGYRLHFEPHNREMMRLGQKEIFGPIQNLKAGFGFPFGNNPDAWRLDKELAGGGPLMDVGIYAVQGSIYTLGEVPEAVTARTQLTNPRLFDEVEETIYWEMEFPSGLTADCESSYSKGYNYLDARAEEGYFRLEPAYGYSGIQGETSKGPMNFKQVNQQALQMDAFADCIFNDRKSRVPGEMGVRDMKILLAIYEAAETGERVELDLDWGYDRVE